MSRDHFLYFALSISFGKVYRDSPLAIDASGESGVELMKEFGRGIGHAIDWS